MANHSNKHLLLFLLVLLLGILQSRACHPTDKEALLEFKRGITDDSSEVLHSWSADQDCCVWDGIDCAPHSGRVVNFTRPGFFTYQGGPMGTVMVGTLSPFLGNLSSLQVLDLGDQKNLTGSIPPELAKLTNLEYLSLGSNNFQGSIPGSFRALTRLNYLDLSGNNLMGSVPTDLFTEMTSLSGLCLHHNKLSGSIPSSIDATVELRYLDLHQNDFNGSIPESIGKLSKLTDLDLSKNQLSGKIPGRILNLEYLKEFDVSGNRLSGEIPRHKIAFSAWSFANNSGLCGPPLPACKH